MSSPLKAGWCLRMVNANVTMRSAVIMEENKRNCKTLRKREPLVARSPKKARIKVVIPKSAIAENME